MSILQPLDKSLLVKCIAELITSSDKNVIQNANSFIMESENHNDFIPLLMEVFESENVHFFIFLP